jgi:hypothetical protein
MAKHAELIKRLDMDERAGKQTADLQAEVIHPVSPTPATGALSKVDPAWEHRKSDG